MKLKSAMHTKHMAFLIQLGFLVRIGIWYNLFMLKNITLESNISQIHNIFEGELDHLVLYDVIAGTYQNCLSHVAILECTSIVQFWYVPELSE